MKNEEVVGKSTCARLAARLWDASSGKVKVGGVDIKTVEPETLLSDYAVVFQDVVLLDEATASLDVENETRFIFKLTKAESAIKYKYGLTNTSLRLTIYGVRYN